MNWTIRRGDDISFTDGKNIQEALSAYVNMEKNFPFNVRIKVSIWPKDQMKEVRHFQIMVVKTVIAEEI